MYVCVCNKVTDKQIHQAARNGASSLNCLNEQLNVGSCCGKCRQCAKKVLNEALKDNWQLEMNPALMPQPA